MQNDKRILFVVYELPPLGGGVARAAQQLLTQFAQQKDITIDVVTSALENEWSSEQFSSNCTVYKVPIGFKPLEKYHRQTVANMILFTINSLVQVNRLLGKNSYDLAHYFGYPSALPGWILKKRVPYIISLRGVDVPGYNQKFGWYYKLFKPISRIVWRQAREVIVNSKQLAQLAKRTLPRKYPVIPNGVDTQLFQPLPAKKKHQRFTITAGGTIMGPKKGLQYLVEGFAQFHVQYADSQLVLFGSGELEAELRAFVEQLGIAGAVKFTGMVTAEQLAQELPKCHVFCLPSLTEGMSNATLEALACGLPIVITPVGGSEELLAEETGILVPKKDPQALVSAFNRLYKQKPYYQKLSRSARVTATTFSWQQSANRYKSMYIKD